MSAILNQQSNFKREDTEHAHDVARRLRSRMLSLAEIARDSETDMVQRIVREAITRHDALGCTLHLINDERKLQIAQIEQIEVIDSKQLQFIAKRIAADAVSAGEIVSVPNLQTRFRGDLLFSNTPVTCSVAVPIFDASREVRGVISAFGGAGRAFNEDDECWLSIVARMIGDQIIAQAGRARIKELSDQLARAMSQPVNETEDEKSAPKKSGLSILVIDDDKTLNEVICEYLQDEGFCVESAGDGLEAIQLFRPDEHSVVMTDVAMPHMNGWEVIGALRTRAPRLPVVLITGYSTSQWNETYLRKQGVVAVLSKPIDFDKLSSVLHGIEIPVQGMM